MQPIPYIPDNAPFTPEQRGWLNGFLAGLFSAAPETASVIPASLKIVVLYASQSGTAEGLARKLVKELKAAKHVVSLVSLEGYTPASLAAETHALFIASTYGEGDPPDAVQPFFQQLCLEHFPRFENLQYSVLALGDSNYEHFCKFGIDLDQKLAALGATRIADRVDCDVELEESFKMWRQAVVSHLQEKTSPVAPHKPETLVPTGAPALPKHTRDNPYLAPLVDKRPLSQGVSTKLTMHIAFSIAEAGLHYEAGDACGVLAQNDPALVEEIIAALHFNGTIPVQLAKAGASTLHDALLNHLQITRLTRKMVQAYATIGRCKALSALLAPEQTAALEAYTYDRGLIDLIHEFPGVLHEPSDLVAMLARLAPRLYSISSSPAAHPGELHTTVSVVRYRSHDRDRGGVCSTFLADRRQQGEALPVYIHPNKRFRLPADTGAPIIMVGPGTGIAPFRGFLHERRVRGHTGRNWLFFGERSASSDFLYQDELQTMQSDGHLTRLDLAFSRDQERKIYVQDRMLEKGAEFYKWLEEGASVYVCGDASRMARDVDATLHTIVEQQARLPTQAAAEYVQQLKDTQRYHRDVY